MIKRTEDLYAGLIFLGIAVFFAATALRTLDVGTPGTMGPGFFPLMIAALLGLLGALIILGARGGKASAPRPPIPWRAVACIIGAPVLFGLTVRSLGLVPALLISLTLGVLATREMTLGRGLAIVLGITAFCVAVFSFGLGISVELVSSRLWR
jgi:hypothetical protein